MSLIRKKARTDLGPGNINQRPEGARPESHANDYVSEAEGTVGEFDNAEHLESLTDASSRGGPLGAENEMPEGGNSTRIPDDCRRRKAS
jgi:hypothetical protein